VTFSNILPEAGRVEVNPATLRGDGISTAQITAWITNSNGVPVPDGQVVQFRTVKRGTNTAGPGRILNPTSTVNGIATATLQSTIVVARTEIDVVVSVDNTELARAPATFTGGGGNITLIANPPVLPANGTSTSAITAVVTDENGNPQVGQTVQFSTEKGSIVATQAVTGANGVATATLTSSPEVGEWRVSAATGSLQRDITVFFQAGTPAVLTLDVTPPSGEPLADGDQAFTLTARVQDAFGNPVDEGTGVTFTLTPAVGPVVSPTTATVRHVTDPVTGRIVAQAVAFLTSILAGDVTITATVTNTTVSDIKQVTFLPGRPAVISVTVTPNSIPADGTSTAIVQATVRDINGNLVADGTSVTFSTTEGDITAQRPIPGSQDTGTTRNGIASATLRSGTQSGTITVRATVPPDGPTGETSVIFTPRTNLTIRLSASPLSIVADGVTTSTITAVVTDANTNAPVAAGTSVTFTTNLGSITLLPPPGNPAGPAGTTDSSGAAQASLRSSTQAGVATVTSSTSGAAPRSIQVNFLPGAVANLSLSTNKTGITADGSDNAVVTVHATDANGNDVPGATVTFSSTAQVAGTTNLLIDGQDVAVQVTTDPTGKASVTVTGTRAQTIILQAASGTAPAATQQLTLRPGPATQVTLTAQPGKIRADGTSTSRITADVRDAFNNTVINGTLVRFATTAGSIKADQPTADPQVGTTVNGRATATLTSGTTANTVATVSATTEATGATGATQVTFTPGPPATVSLSPSPTAVQVFLDLNNNNLVDAGEPVNTSTLTAVVRDSTGQPVENGTVVEFRTTLGTFDPNPFTPLPTIQSTTVNGIATARLTSQTLAGLATVTATALDAAGNPVVGNTSAVEVVPGPPATVTVNANPANILADGKSKSTVTAVVRDWENNNVADGTVVTLTASGGTMPTIPPDEPDLDPATTGYQVRTINGVATATLTSSTKAGRKLVTASAGTATGNTQVVFSSEVIGNITLGFSTGVTYTPAIWANNGQAGGSIGVIAQVTTEDGDPVADGTTIKFRILSKASGRPDGRVTPGTVGTTNGVANTTVYSSDQAGVHVIRAEVYDAEGNVVFEAPRDIYFTGNVHQILLDTSYNGLSISLRQRTSYVVGVGEIYPHNTNSPPRPSYVPADCSDNWYINQSGDGIRYRAQALDENQLPVPDGTTITFWVAGNASLSVPSAPTRNGWTTTPEGWTGTMTGGDTCVCHTLYAETFLSPGSASVVRTYQRVYVLDTNNCQ
jgi:adhesin/invasin